MKEEDIKSGIMKENFPIDKLIEQLENNVLKSRNDTENIQDLINERNKQNKRIEELVLSLEQKEAIIKEAREYIYKLQENDDIEIWREDGYWAYLLQILDKN